MNYVNLKTEKDLVRHALLADEKIVELSVKFPPKIFSSQHMAKIYMLVLSHWDRFGKRATISELLAALDKEQINEEDRDNYYTLAKSLYVPQPPDQDYHFCKDELLKLWRARSLMNAIKDSSELIDKGDLNKGETALRGILDEPLFAGAENIQEYEFGSSVDLIIDRVHDMKNNPHKYQGIPTGIAELDDHLKGIMPSEVGLVVGKTAGFKSTTLYNFAIESYLDGHDTMLITIEMSGEQILRRLYGRVSQIEITKLDEALVSEEQLAAMRVTVKQYQERKKNKLFILDIPTGCTVDLLKAKIREYRRRCNLELVVVDYMQIMETRSGDVDLYDWKALAIISKKIKETARQFNLAIWTAAQQVAGLKANKDEDSLEDVAFSKAASQNVDILLKLNQTDQQKLAKEVDLRVLKIRRKATCPPIGLKPDPAFGRIHAKA